MDVKLAHQPGVEESIAHFLMVVDPSSKRSQTMHKMSTTSRVSTDYPIKREKNGVPQKTIQKTVKKAIRHDQMVLFEKDQEKENKVQKTHQPLSRNLKCHNDDDECFSSDDEEVQDEESSMSPGAVAVSGISSSLPGEANEGDVPSLMPESTLISAVLVEEHDVTLSSASFVEAKPVSKLRCKYVAVGAILLALVIAASVTAIVITASSNADEPSPSPVQDEPFSPVVTVTLQLDEAPGEVGWQLDCDGQMVGNQSVGTYVSTYQLDRQRFDVPEGSLCTFTIHDIGGNGLCCGNGEGYYKVHVGAMISDDNSIRAQGGDSFEFEETASFFVTEPWEQLGGIAGEVVNSYAGFSVSLSADGLIMAVGSPGLVSFELNNSDIGQLEVMKFNPKTKDWTQLGSKIETGIPGDYFGFAVSLSDDGTIVAVSAPFSHLMTGLVRVYQYDSDSDDWIQLGQDLTGGVAFSVFGLSMSISLSRQGAVLAVGAPSDGGFQATPGFARIFRLVGPTWERIGDDINGDNIGDHFGWSVSLSGTGNLLAIGAIVPFNNTRSGGYVRLYDIYISEENMYWEKETEDLVYKHGTDDWFGFSLDLSFDGTILAVGAPGYFPLFKRGTNEANSYVQVYERMPDTMRWGEMGQELKGDHDGDNLGTALCLSWKGDILAIGAPFNDRSATTAGMVTSFKFDETSSNWIALGQPILGVEAESLTGWSVSLSKEAHYMAVGSLRETVNTIFQAGHVRFFG